MTDLRKRVLVAAVGIPAIVLLSMEGGLPFAGFVALISSLALHELYRLAESKGVFPHRTAGILFGLCVNAVFVFDILRDAMVAALDSMGIALPAPSSTQFLMILFLLFVPGMLVCELKRSRGSPLLNLSVTAFGALYVSLLFGSLTGLRQIFNPQDFPLHRYFDVIGPSVDGETVRAIDRWGALTTVTLFASIWLCDTAAYFVGRAWGTHKLFERVSPKKTWEGAAAGFAAAVTVFLAAQMVLLPFLTVRDAVVCGAVVGVFGQVGDLGESLLKRDAGVKDSSGLIPGHGGVLDRFDSLLYVSPLLFLYLDFVVFAP
jgi:phosphatidate cytidylyltransferase